MGESRNFDSIFTILRGFREKEEFCDVELIVENKKFYAHKVILAASSEYFRAMFLGSLVENELSVINLHGVRADIFSLLLDSIYGCTLEVKCDAAEDLIVAADMLQLTGAVEACENFMITHLDVGNCIGFHCFSKQYGFQNLLRASWEFILVNFNQVSFEDEFVMAPFEVINCLTKSEEIAISSEFEVMRCVIRWLMHDPRSRRKLCVTLFKNVRTNLIAPHQINQVLFQVEDVCVKVAIKVLTLNDPVAKARRNDPRKQSQPRRSARKSFYAIGGSVPRHTRRHTWEDRTLNVVSYVERYDSFSSQWDRYPVSMREARTSPAVVQMDRKIYAIGGEKDCMVYGSIECYDTSNGTWRLDLPSMAVPRTSCQAVIHDYNIYIIGGDFGSGAGESIEVYNPMKNTCQLMSFTLQTARHSFGAVCFEGVLYMAGGVALSERELKTMECYDLGRHDWWFAKDMTTKRANFGLVNVGPMIYAIGGHNEDQGTLRSVEVYDIYSNCWQACAPMAQPRAGAFISVLDYMIVATGGKCLVRDQEGQTTWQILCDSESYDTKTGNWTQTPNMNLDPRCDGGAVVI